MSTLNAINRDDDIASRGELCKVHNYDCLLYTSDAADE